MGQYGRDTEQNFEKRAISTQILREVYTIKEGNLETISMYRTNVEQSKATFKILTFKKG